MFFGVKLALMDRPAFEKLVQSCLRHLPSRFKQKLENIAIEIEDRPSPDLLKDMGIKSGTLFGLYQGVPLTKRTWNYGNMLPDRIVIYQKPIEAAASSSEGIEEIVGNTVMHELGHYFGFSDSELDKMEDEKRRGKRRQK